jgi:inorganic pyrophosphatase
MKSGTNFWQELSELAHSGSMILDRPRGRAHPRYPDLIYPLDYGYLENTSASDADGIDVWIGSKDEKRLTGILCTFDRLKRDAEIKLLIGCTLEDVETIQGFNSDISTFFIPNPMVEHDLSDEFS